jgi:hypothetical protein
MALSARDNSPGMTRKCKSSNQTGEAIATIDNLSSGYSGNVEAADLFKIAFPCLARFKIQVAALLMVPRSRFADILPI